MFGRLKTSHVGFDEVPTGTHGIFSDDCCKTLIGSLVVAKDDNYPGATMEKWRWKSGYDFPSVTTFYLKCRSDHTIANPSFEYHYQHKDLPNTLPDSRKMMNVELDDDKWQLWKLTRGIRATEADIGYFRLDLPRSSTRTGWNHFNSNWFIDPAAVGDQHGVIPLDDGEILRFKRPSQNGAGVWRYLVVAASKYPTP